MSTDARPANACTNSCVNSTLLNYIRRNDHTVLRASIVGMVLTLERPEGSNGPLIGFLDLKFEAFKQSKKNFQYL